MEFRNLDFARHLPETITCVHRGNMETRPARHGSLQEAVDAMGAGSAKAQALHQIITTWDKLRTSNHRLYIYADASTKKVMGILRTGVKKLFLLVPHLARGRRGDGHVEIEPNCVLDFYVHESCQRGGVGHALFEYMLEAEGTTPSQLAYDRPSPKLIGFLRKHYGLSRYVPQANNYVVFDEYFTGAATGPAPSTPTRDEYATATPKRGGAGATPSAAATTPARSGAPSITSVTPGSRASLPPIKTSAAAAPLPDEVDPIEHVTTQTQSLDLSAPASPPPTSPPSRAPLPAAGGSVRRTTSIGGAGVLPGTSVASTTTPARGPRATPASEPRRSLNYNVDELIPRTTSGAYGRSRYVPPVPATAPRASRQDVGAGAREEVDEAPVEDRGSPKPTVASTMTTPARDRGTPGRASLSQSLPRDSYSRDSYSREGVARDPYAVGSPSVAAGASSRGSTGTAYHWMMSSPGVSSTLAPSAYLNATRKR